MKRDMDLVRNILAAVEDADGPINTDFLAIGGLFWSSDELTGNQTRCAYSLRIKISSTTWRR